MEGKWEDGRECGAAESSAVVSPSALEGSDLTQEPLEHLWKCGCLCPTVVPTLLGGGLADGSARGIVSSRNLLGMSPSNLALAEGQRQQQ